VRASTSARHATRFAGRLALALLGLTMLGLGAPAVSAADALSLTTPYPAVVVTPGSKVGFDLAVKTNAAARVDLKVMGVPTGWTATLQGGGFVVDAVHADGKAATSVRLEVDVPATASGTSHLVVEASGNGQIVDLGLDIRVSAEGGDVSLTTDVTKLHDTSTATFTFNLTIHNDTPQDQTFVVTATGPTAWTVSTRLTGQSQVASAVVRAGTTAAVSVSAQAPDGTAAGDYPIDVVATAGDKQLTQQLTVEITGSYTISMATPDQVLSSSGTAGAATTQQLTITNSGSAPVTNVKLTATAPTNWKVTFDKDAIDTIPAGEQVTVTASITPSADAIAGDYQITFRASSAENTSSSIDIRFTVQTSLLWAIVGIILIGGVFGGLWWVFRRYGRR
jgi:uncharacterized membrane protein